MQQVKRISTVLAVAATALTMLVQPAGAESVPPPTPTGVKVKEYSGTGAQVTFDAESGSVADVSSKSRAWTALASSRTGDRGLRIQANRQAGFARWGADVVPQGHRYAAARAWVRVESWQAGESVDLLTITNTQGSRHFDFFVSAQTGRFQWDIYRTSADRSNFVATPGQWYLIEVRLSYAWSQHTAEVRIDGEHQGTITSPGGDTTVQSLIVGSYGTKTHSQDYDDIALQVGPNPLPWLSPGAARRIEVQWNPVVDTGSGLREYQIWRDGRWYGWKPAGITHFVDTDPIVGAAYQLRAVDRHLNSSGWSPRAWAWAGK